MRDLGLNEAEALDHVKNQYYRGYYRDSLYEEHSDCIGSFNYDIQSQIMSVSTTSEICHEDITTLASEMPFQVEITSTTHSLDELSLITTQINESVVSPDTIISNAEVDFEEGRILIFVPPHETGIQASGSTIENELADNLQEEVQEDVEFFVVEDP